MTRRFCKRVARRAGFTLVEALIALALLGLVIGLLADTASEYATIILFQEEKDSTAQALAGLEKLTRELETAVVITVPSGGAPTDWVEFEIVDSDSPDRASDPKNWTPWRPSDRVTVSYSLSDGALLRKATKNGVSTQSIVAPKVDGLACKLDADRHLEIQISVLEKRKVVTFSSTAFRWLP